MNWSLLIVFIFLLLNVFFVLAEFSIVKAQAAKLEVLQNRGKKRAGLVLSMMGRMERYFSAIQIGVTMSTMAVGWAGEPFIANILGQIFPWTEWLGPISQYIHSIVAFGIIIYIQIVFAELVPRYTAVRHAETVALWVAYPLEIYSRFVRIPVWILSKSSVAIAKFFGAAPGGDHSTAFSEEEIRVLMGTAQEKGLLPLDRLLLMENLLDFSTLRVRDAMVPRDKVVFLSTAKSWEENTALVKTHHFSRYPLGNPDLDHVDGIVHVKDIIGRDSTAALPQLKRPLQRVQDSELLSPLLKTMTLQGHHLMLCQKGDKVSGILTLEDVLEEIVGEIHDEFDAPKAWSLHQYLSSDMVKLNMAQSTPTEAIHQLIQLVGAKEPHLNLDFAEKAVCEREKQLPTAIGKSVAIPHARLASISRPYIVLGRTPKSFTFTPPDNAPVRLIFLILTPSSTPMEQLRILSRVAMLVNNETVHKQIFKAKSAAAMVDVIRTSETLISG